MSLREKVLKLAIASSMMATVFHPVLASAQSSSMQAGTFERSLEFDGRVRTYRVHLPDLPVPDAGMPVLIVLHGGGGTGRQVERSTGFSELADQAGFVAVYPDGTGRGNLLTWDAHNCCAYAFSQQVDDIGYISALIERLVIDFDIDGSRIYVTGHSNGAMMTFRLACELSDKIAAAAPYAGALNTSDCAPDQPVPILIMNAEGDMNVPVAGGTSPNVGVGSEDSRVDRPTSYAVDTWIELNGCDPNPAVVEIAAATTSTYEPCTDGAQVEQVLINGWEHSWPSIPNGAPLDASSVIWDFVSQFSKDPA